MPSKSRWTLNPRKWFGMRSNVGQKQEKNINTVSRAPLPPPPTATTTTRTIPSTSSIPRIFSGKNKVQVVPLLISNDVNKVNTTITQLQLPAFGIRREKTLQTTTMTTTAAAVALRQNTFHATHHCTEPTIRKNSRIQEEELSIDATRWNIQSIPASIYENSSLIKPTDMSVSNMSHRCLIDYPRQSTTILEDSSFPTRSSSRSSSINDDNDNSSSSGVFTDERQRTESKDTLSTLEVLSIESIADSQTSLNHCPIRPIIHHYRRPMSVFETNDDKPQQRQNSLRRSHRSQSAEGILKDNQSKSRQSSAVIIKKLDKRLPMHQYPSGTLEKAGFIRIAHDTYRLTNHNQIDPTAHSRENSFQSYEPYLNPDDQLRSANDEECYATLPRTSSTEQLNQNNIQNDLRVIVDECIRPMVNSIGKTNRLNKNHHHRYKRSQQTHTQPNVDNITDKLLSSIDYSIYTRYQRCN